MEAWNTASNAESKSIDVWKYYSLDVASQLGGDLEVTDPKHELNQLESDIKYANVSQYKDLIIDLIDAGDGFSDPNLYIKLNDSEPTLTSNDLRCSFYGEDVCIINGKELEAAKTSKVTIGVYCKKECKFRVEAAMQAEVNLRPGKMHNIYFRENQQRILRFEIPENTGSGRDDIETIEIKGINENKFAQFEMLILQGNVVPDTSEALILEPAWENGYIGKFYKGCYCFCTNCNYTVLVSSKSEGYISIGAKISGKTVDLKSFPGGETYDTVRYWDT